MNYNLGQQKPAMSRNKECNKKAKGSYNRQPSPTILLYHGGGMGLHVGPRMAFRPRDKYFVGDSEATASMECF